MSDTIDKLKKLYEEHRWKDISDFYVKLSYSERMALEKDEEAVAICVKALRGINNFDRANLLEKKASRCLSSRVSLHDIFRLVFYSKSYRGFDVRELARYAVHELNKENQGMWVDFIHLLVSNSSSGDYFEFEKRYGLKKTEPPSHRKVFISGFGRSGTGALRSFLNEYHEVYEVPGSEIQVISGFRGLWPIFKTTSKESFRKSFLDFFAVHALGVSALNHNQDEKELDRAIKIISRSDEKLFFEAFYCFFVEVYFDSSFSESLIEKSCKSFLNRYLSALKKPDHKCVFLFNNVVNASKIKMMRLVDNYVCFPVTRDPRSQYASFLETQKPGWSAKDFLDHFRRFDDSFNRGLRSLKSDAEKIKVVRFEDVVFSEDFRQSLVKVCGLDNSKATRFSRLKPEQSMENMFLHNKKEFSDKKDDFEYILQELSDRCISSQYS